MTKFTAPSRQASLVFQRWGRFCGWGITRHGRLFLDRRCAALPLTVCGAEHLRAALAGPAIIVANHVLIRAENAPLGLWTQARALSLLNQPPDSFLLRRIVRAETGLTLHVVAKCDRGWWSPRPIVKFLQKRVGQPFGKGVMEGMEFVPIEHNPDCFHRTFFQSAGQPIRRGLPILIFPSKLEYDENGCYDPLTRSAHAEPCILPGAAHLARKFSLPILPAYIHGGESWRPGEQTCVRFGPAFRTNGLTKTEINRLVVERVRALQITEQVVPEVALTVSALSAAFSSAST